MGKKVPQIEAVWPIWWVPGAYPPSLLEEVPVVLPSVEAGEGNDDDRDNNKSDGTDNDEDAEENWEDDDEHTSLFGPLGPTLVPLACLRIPSLKCGSLTGIDTNSGLWVGVINKGVVVMLHITTLK